MKTLYKLTDQNMQTHRAFQWVLHEPRETTGVGDLCGPGWLHAYTDPLLAVLLNPIHANFKNPRLFKANWAGGKMKSDMGLKVGVTRLTLVEEMPLPSITPTQRVAFGVLCAKRVCKDPAWHTWADNWLSGVDRSKSAADAAEWAAAWAEWAAARRPLPLRAIARKAMTYV